MLWALTAASLLITASGATLSPFLHDLARDLRVGFATVAHLVSWQAVAWGSSALVAGSLSDRIGRRPLLVFGLIGLGVSRIGLASAEDYIAATLWQLLAGLCGGAFMGAVFAAVSDHVPLERRGRALGLVITGQSLALVLGAPAVSLLAAVSGWRGAMAAYGALAVVLGIAVSFAVPRDTPHAASPFHPLRGFAVFRQPQIARLLVAGVAERMCYAVVVVFYAAYLQATYRVSLEQLALALGIVASGNVVGNVAGSRAADRLRQPMRLFVGAMLSTALLVPPALLWHPSLAASVALGFCFAAINASGRPAVLVTLSGVPRELRGAVMGVNVTMASTGWLVMASVGGALIGSFGFGALAILASSAALLGAALAAWWLRSAIAEQRHGVA